MATVNISDRISYQGLRDCFEALVPLDGSVTWDASSIDDGNEEAKEVTVTGAALGDFVLCSLGVDVADLTLTGAVTAADTVTLVLANNTGGAVDLASTTAYARVLPRGNVLQA